jgi:hypothetical protein
MPGQTASSFIDALAIRWRMIPPTVALTRAGAHNLIRGSVLTLAAVIRSCTGDLPRALAVLQEATLQDHADGTRLLQGHTLRIVAVMLARLGEAGPAAVLSGAFAVRFPASISARRQCQVSGEATARLAR